MTRLWPLAEPQRSFSFPLPSAPTPLAMSQSGGAGPWAMVSVKAAVPLTQPLFAGYRLNKKIEALKQAVPGRWTRGDVVKVTIAVEATAERNWVVVYDPVPTGATILGGLGGQSEMLDAQAKASDGTSFTVTDADGKQWKVEVGTQPAYVERRPDSYRGYYSWVPRGTFALVYVMRLNSSGTFSLPATRVEAMYSPEIRAQVPNQTVTVAQR
jgi:uncharacterized protein YfaS (alpha-2-macroglobulin family)